MAPVPTAVLPKNSQPSPPHTTQQIQVSKIAIEAATIDVGGVYKRFATRPVGLTVEEARTRLSEYGPNSLIKDHRIPARLSASSL